VESRPGAKKSFEAPSATIRLFWHHVAAYLANTAYVAYVVFAYVFAGDASRSWSFWLGRWRRLPAAASARATAEAAAPGEREGGVPDRRVLQGDAADECR
jgi:hypothetical protein